MHVNLITVGLDRKMRECLKDGTVGTQISKGSAKTKSVPAKAMPSGMVSISQSIAKAGSYCVRVHEFP